MIAVSPTRTKPYIWESGSIDQIHEIIEVTAAASEVEAPRSRADQQIHDACQQVNNVVELLETAHPQWIQSQWQ